MSRLLSFLTVALIAAFLVGGSGIGSAMAMGSIDSPPISERGEATDDASFSDVAITPPGVALAPPGPQGPVVSTQIRPVMPAPAGGIFRPPSSLRA